MFVALIVNNMPEKQYKYKIKELVAQLPRHITNKSIQEAIGISARTFSRWMNLTTDDTHSASADELRLLAAYFSKVLDRTITVDDLFNTAPAFEFIAH